MLHPYVVFDSYNKKTSSNQDIGAKGSRKKNIFLVARPLRP